MASVEGPGGLNRAMGESYMMKVPRSWSLSDSKLDPGPFGGDNEKVNQIFRPLSAKPHYQETFMKNIRSTRKPAGLPGTIYTYGIIFCSACVLFLSACDSKKADPTTVTKTVTPAETTQPTQDPITLAEDAISETAYRRHIEILSSDEFGGRAPGSPGEQLTIDYLTAAFSDLGLEPANGDSYIQEVPLAWVNAVNKPGLLISGGVGADMNLAYIDDQVIWTRKQLTNAAIENSDMVFVGYGIVAPEREWNDYAGVDVAGKTVVMLVNDPGYATQDPELFNGNAMTYYGRWDYKYDEAARQGATGAIIIHDTLPAAYGWSTVMNSWTGPQFAMVLPDKGENLASVEGWITLDLSLIHI